MKIRVILGDQLFPVGNLSRDETVFMAEAWDLCTRHRYHKQ